MQSNGGLAAASLRRGAAGGAAGIRAGRRRQRGGATGEEDRRRQRTAWRHGRDDVRRVAYPRRPAGDAQLGRCCTATRCARPTIDIDSVGAGGGSIAWIDAGGGVRIGPESAAADPGPACYGRGGTRPTVTDCNVILGYVDPETLPRRRVSSSTRRRRNAPCRSISAKPLGVSRAGGGRMRASHRQCADGAGDAPHDRGARLRSARFHLCLLRRRGSGARRRPRQGAGDPAGRRAAAAGPVQRVRHDRRRPG